MAGLPATGELTYNGYTFDGLTNITVDVAFEYDEAGRSVISTKNLITVNAVVADDDGLDGDLENIRERLSQPGAKIKFKDKGFGDDIVINQGDINGGPFPRELSWRPIGDDKAAEVSWQVEVTTAHCQPGRRPRYRGIKALNWDVSFSINEHGDTTRLIVGYLEIVVGVGPTATDTADRYREKFAAAALKGFKRQQNWKVSKDRKRLDFTITDTQIPTPNPYPAHATDISGTHSFSFRRPRRGAPSYRNNISMQITPSVQVSGAQAYALFLVFVQQRLKIAASRGRQPWIESIDVQENLFGRPQSFSIGYSCLRPVRDIVRDTGLWQPLGTDWNKWRVSLSGSAFNFRGHAQLKDLAANDAVVSLCSPTDTAYPNNEQVVFGKRSTPPSLGLTNQKPSPDKSYRKYKNVLVVESEAPTVDQHTIQNPFADDAGVEVPSAENQTQDAIQRTTGPATTESTGQSGRVSATIHTGTINRWRVYMVGQAERVGYPVPRPKLEQVGTRTAHPSRQAFSQHSTEESFGVDLYRAQWVLEYILDDSPGPVVAPGDVMK